MHARIQTGANQAKPKRRLLPPGFDAFSSGCDVGSPAAPTMYQRWPKPYGVIAYDWDPADSDGAAYNETLRERGSYAESYPQMKDWGREMKRN